MGSRGAEAGAAGWERYEELAKAAVVADPHGGARFFLKTRVQRGRGVQIASRVAAAGASASYRTVAPSRLGRLTRLLRFVMQEVLGPMKPVLAADTSAAVAAAAAEAAKAAASAPRAPNAPPSSTNKQKKTKTTNKTVKTQRGKKR